MTGTSLLNFNDGNGPTTTTSEWGNGVNVMGACSQKHTSTKYKGYADGLFEQLGKSHVGGLGEAQNILEDTGYTNFFRMRQYPLSSSNLPEVFITDSQNPHQQKAIPNHCLNNWNKGESPANKFVVLVGGASNLPALLEDHSESKQLDRAEKELQNTYLISSKHMQRLDDATSHGIKNALNQVTQQIKTEKVKNPEVLIYYSGHGGALGVSHHFPFLDKRSEGEATGIIALKDKIYFDVELKQLLKTLPPDIKTTVIMSTCHAGSWIA